MDQGEEDSSMAGGASQTSSAATTPKTSTPSTQAAAMPDLLGDLLDMDMMGSASAAPAPVAASGGGDVLDLLGGLGLDDDDAAPPATAAPVVESETKSVVQPPSTPTINRLPVLLDATKGKGLVIRGAITRSSASRRITYNLEFENVSAGVTLDGIMAQFNKNAFGLAPGTQSVPVAPIAPGATCTAALTITQRPDLVAAASASPTLQVAIKTNQLGVLYLADTVPLAAVLSEQGMIESAEFVAGWKAIPESQEVQQEVSVTITDVAAAKLKLEASNLFVLAHKVVSQEEVLYCTGKIDIPGAPVQALLEVRFVQGQRGVRVFYRSGRQDMAPLVFIAVAAALNSS